jgi:hypothetical protein
MAKSAISAVRAVLAGLRLAQRARLCLSPLTPTRLPANALPAGAVAYEASQSASVQPKPAS